jgi:hypothetical protein
MARLIKVQNKVINLDAMAYVDFLDSGRAMMIMMGLTQEKQNVSIDPLDASKLKALLEKECLPPA